MRGMEYIVKLRKAGYRPDHVVLDHTQQTECLPNWLQIEPDDRPELLDLRPLVGLVVTVALETIERCKRWEAPLVAAKVRTLLLAPAKGLPEAVVIDWEIQ